MTEGQNQAFRTIRETLDDIERQVTAGMPYEDLMDGLSGLSDQLIGFRWDLMGSRQSLADHRRKLFYHRPEPEGERDKDE